MIEEVKVTEITPNPYQPRLEYDPESITQLAESIRSQGLLQLPIGRRLNGRLELAAGHRRWKAIEELGWDQLQVDVRELTDEQMFEVAVTENTARQDLTPIELARAMQAAREQFGKTSAEVGELFGLSAPAVRNYLRLLELPESVQDLVEDGQISQSSARKLLTVQRVAPQRVEQLAQEISGGSGEGMTESGINRAIQEGIERKAGAVKMWTKWMDGEPRGGYGLWPLSEWTPDEPQKVTRGAFFKAFPAWSDFMPLIGDLLSDSERGKLIDAMMAAAAEGQDAPTLSQTYDVPEELAGDVISMVWPPKCTACPHYVVFEGNHYCGLKACFQNKKDAWIQAETARLSEELGIPIYDPDKDGEGFVAWSYAYGKEREKWEGWFEARDPYLRLRPKAAQYGAHEGTDSHCTQVITIRPQEVEKLEKQEADQAREEELQAERRAERERAQHMTELAGAWFEQHAVDVLAQAFDHVHQALVRRLTLAWFSNWTIAQATGQDWGWDDPPPSPPDPEICAQLLARGIFWEDAPAEKKSAGPAGLAQYLAGAAGELGLELPADWHSNAEAFTAPEPEESVSAETESHG